MPSDRASFCSIGRAQRPGISHVAAALLVLSLAPGCSDTSVAPINFEDVTSGSGLDKFVGMTHGVAWGDVDRDGKPDLYLTNHLIPPTLLRNIGNGRFEDVTAQWLQPDDLKGDRHGAGWADLDNDGRLDLIQLTGAKMGVGEEPKRLFMNRGDRFEEEAGRRGVSNPQGRTRMPAWLDVDGDSRLDLIQGAEPRLDDIEPPLTYLQEDGHFRKSPEAIPFRARGVPFCVVTELDGDHRAELVCRVQGKNLTAQIFTTRDLPARELDLLPVSAFEDIAAGDFDNDGAIDMFLARRNPPGKVAFGRPADNVAIADLWVNERELAQPTEFAVQTQGKLRVTVAPKQPSGLMTPDQVRLGAKGSGLDSFEFVLDPQAPASAGVAGGPANDIQLRLGFERPDRWRVVFVGPDGSTLEKPRTAHVQLAFTADTPISEMKAAGDAERPEQAPQRLFMNRGGKLIEEGDKRGVNEKSVTAMNVVAVDFNNDMWLDLFILGSGDIGMHHNVLLLNQGNGHFKVHTLTGGAEGPRTGVGDSVTAADFDGDGFVDLLVASGGSMGRSLGLPSDRGGYRLFRNAGNSNHWLEIDLEGTRSNRDGIGASVRVTAGGVTQVRFQDGGIHHRGQNHSRLHFGLGKHAQVEKISIQWPSGTTQELSSVAANQRMRITESDK